MQLVCYIDYDLGITERPIYTVPVVSTSENQDLLVTEIYRFLILNTLSQNDPTLIIYRNEFLLALVSYVYTVLKVKGYNVATKFQRLSFEERQI